MARRGDSERSRKDHLLQVSWDSFGTRIRRAGDEQVLRQKDLQKRGPIKSHGSPTGLMGLRLMEGSPTSPTTLRVGLVGLTKLGLPRCGPTPQLSRRLIRCSAAAPCDPNYPQWRPAA